MTARMRHLRHRDLDGLARDRLDHTKDALALGLPPGAKPEYTVTADNLQNHIVVTGEDTLAVGNPRVIFEGDDLPANVETGVIYWLRDDGTNLYTLHLNKADAAAGANELVIADDGTGTITMTILD